MSTEKLESKADNFAQYCALMTSFAENQLDFHRKSYYSVCVSMNAFFFFSKVMTLSSVVVCREKLTLA